MEPLLPPIPPIDIKEPKESVGLIDFKRVLTLDGKITGDIAEKFYQQSHQAEFSLQWQQCIYDGAPDYIKMRVKTSYTQLNISEAVAHNWNPHLLNYKEIAALVFKLRQNGNSSSDIQCYQYIQFRMVN